MAFLIEALTLGLLNGLGPCMVACAPVLIPVIASTSKNYKEGLISTIFFSFGRIISYMVLGMLSGLAGESFERFISAKVVGVFIILLAFFLMFNIHTRCLVSKIKITNNRMLFVAGIVMGFTPCAPMLGALAIAVLSKSWLIGTVVGFLFGIGTMLSPLLLLGTLSGAWAKKVMSNPEFMNVNRYVCSGFLLLLGILYLASTTV